MSEEGETKFVALAQIPKDQMLTWTLVPKKGRLLAAETIGETLSNVAKLLKSFDEEYGNGGLFVAVTGMSLDDDGKVTFHLASLPVDPTTKQE